MNSYNKNFFLTKFAVLLFTFAHVLAALFSVNIAIVYGVTFLIAVFHFFRLYVPKNPTNLIAYLYLFYIVVMGAISFYSCNGMDSYKVLAQGMICLCLPPIFFILISNQTDQNKFYFVSKFLPLLLCLSAAISITYYFFDFQLFGLIKHPVYTDRIYYDSTVDRRAIGLISSPQGHALMMIFLLVIGMKNLKINNFAPISIILSLAGGVLSGSKAYILALATLFFAVKPMLTSIFLTFAIFATFCFESSYVLFSDGLRGLSLIDVLFNIKEYPATNIWLTTIDEIKSNALWGVGPGKLASISETLDIGSFSVKSAESYYLQLIAEIGFVGFLFFCLFIYFALSKQVQAASNHIKPVFILPILINGFFTPALYGVVNAVLLGIFLGLSGKKYG